MNALRLPTPNEIGDFRNQVTALAHKAKTDEMRQLAAHVLELELDPETERLFVLAAVLKYNVNGCGTGMACELIMALNLRPHGIKGAKTLAEYHAIKYGGRHE